MKRARYLLLVLIVLAAAALPALTRAGSASTSTPRADTSPTPTLSRLQQGSTRPLEAGTTGAEEQPTPADAPNTRNANDFDHGFYLGQILTIAEMISASFERQSALTGAPTFDASWRFAMASEPRLWQAVYAELLTFDAPPLFATAHALLLDAFGTLDRAAPYCIQAFENVDSDVLPICTDAVREYTDKLDLATAEINRVRKSLGL